MSLTLRVSFAFTPPDDPDDLKPISFEAVLWNRGEPNESEDNAMGAVLEKFELSADGTSVDWGGEGTPEEWTSDFDLADYIGCPPTLVPEAEAKAHALLAQLVAVFE